MAKRINRRLIVWRSEVDERPRSRVRSRPPKNVLLEKQKKKEYFHYADKSPDVGDFFVVGTRADGSRLILDTKPKREEAEEVVGFLLAQGIEGYVSLVVEWSTFSATGERNHNGDGIYEDEEDDEE